MARRFASISIEDFEEKLTKEAKKYHDSEIEVEDIDTIDGLLYNSFYGGGDHRFSPKVEKDISKVQFDFENMGCTENDCYVNGAKSLMGLKTLTNGMTYIGVIAGGDWEHPVFFILYWDGKNIRGYIPTDGNTWNKKYKTAYGSEDDSDKYWNDIKGKSKDVIEKLEQLLERFVDNPPAFDAMAVTNDIMNRIQKKD